jgi:hypothetical protein
VLAWALYAVVLLALASFPVLDRMARDAGRPDLALLAPFVVAPSLAALTALTVLLGLGYAAVVLLLGRLLPDSSSLGVAAATLAVAAVFQPARRRVQAAADRRFDRRRHDAARIIEGFGGRLRDQVDLDTLTAELLAVAERTMQPTRASLWLRPPP